MRYIRCEAKFLLASIHVVAATLRTNHAFPNPTNHTARYKNVFCHSEFSPHWRKALGRISGEFETGDGTSRQVRGNRAGEALKCYSKYCSRVSISKKQAAEGNGTRPGRKIEGLRPNKCNATRRNNRPRKKYNRTVSCHRFGGCVGGHTGFLPVRTRASYKSRRYGDLWPKHRLPHPHSIVDCSAHLNHLWTQYL